MKIRQGFVSNSSSSSFICQVSGIINEGMDDTPLSSFGLVACENWHTFFKEYTVDEDADDIYLVGEAYYYNEYDDLRLKKEHCPICTLKHITKTCLINYANTKTNFDFKGLAKEINNKFNNLEELNSYFQEERNEN